MTLPCRSAAVEEAPAAIGVPIDWSLAEAIAGELPEKSDGTQHPLLDVGRPAN